MSAFPCQSHPARCQHSQQLCLTQASLPAALLQWQPEPPACAAGKRGWVHVEASDGSREARARVSRRRGRPGDAAVASPGGHEADDCGEGTTWQLPPKLHIRAETL